MSNPCPEKILLDMTVEAFGSPGRLIDEAKAKRTPCTCFKMDAAELCFSPGVIGTLSKRQVELYCPEKRYEESPGIKRRYQSFLAARDICKAEIEKIPKGERLDPWLSCMGRELPKHGIEI